MIVFFRITSGLIALIATLGAIYLLIPGGPDTLVELTSRPSVSAALTVLAGAIGAAFLWSVAELIQRARQALTILDPPIPTSASADKTRDPARFSPGRAAHQTEHPQGNGSHGRPLLDAEA